MHAHAPRAHGGREELQIDMKFMSYIRSESGHEWVRTHVIRASLDSRNGSNNSLGKSALICSAINKADSDAIDKGASRGEYDALRKR
ncbi:hypothetical protein OWS73_16265 [Burkholderia sp. 1B3(2022)]|uniref:hypothetical protein n=1 Tax=Burkholderia sp. 1B3(2022) TaxID=2997425 RepID=UPI002FC7FC10